jgi:hypothetical protein
LENSVEKSESRFSEYVKKLEESGLKVKIATEPGKEMVFVGGVRTPPKKSA